MNIENKHIIQTKALAIGYSTKSDPLVVSKNIKQLEDSLPASHFFRVHKSYLINLYGVDKIDKADGMTVHLTSGHQAMVSVRKKAAFLEALERL